MKQKLIDKILYVFDVTPYEITEDADAADVIKVQQECYEGFIALNPDLANKIVKYNYHMFTVNQLEWAPYVDQPDPEPETRNSITGADMDENTGLYGTVTLSLEDELPLVVEYDEEGDEYSPFEVANTLYISSADLTDSSKYSWTKDGEPIEGVLAEGADTEPLVYTYENNGEDAPMFTVDEDENGNIATITPDATGVFVATLIPEPETYHVYLNPTSDASQETLTVTIDDVTVDEWSYDESAEAYVFDVPEGSVFKMIPSGDPVDWTLTSDTEIDMVDDCWSISPTEDIHITIDYVAPSEEATECTVTLTGTGASDTYINVEVGGSLITDFTDYIDQETGDVSFTLNADEDIKIYPLDNQENYTVTSDDAGIDVDDSDQYYWYATIGNDATITIDYTESAPE